MQTAIAIAPAPDGTSGARTGSAVEAMLDYVTPGPGKPAIDAAAHGSRVERNFTADRRPVWIENGWLAPDASLDREGFALTRHETALHHFDDKQDIEAVYYPEMAALIREATGASQVVVFDHNLRLDAGDGAGLGNRRPAVRRVHNDYTSRSAPQRLSGILGRSTAEIRRYAVVNVWRPIKGPVETAPLALADATSVAADDVVAADLIYPDRTGEIYYATWNQRHRWIYYPRMDCNEALLIKGYDSLTDGRARFALHTAFDDPTTPRGAPPRESIEVRALALFE